MQFDPIDLKNIGLSKYLIDKIMKLGVGTAMVLTKKVHVTADELLGLQFIPKVLVDAPGAGKFITSLKVVFKFNPGSTPYSATTLSIGYTDGTSSSGTSAYSLPPASNFGFSSKPEDSTTTDIVNYALCILSGSPVTGGNGTLDVYVTYTITSL